MNRRRFIAGATAFFAAPLSVEAQQAPKAWRVGLLHPRDPSAPIIAAFLQQMRTLGYLEGQNLIVQNGFAEGHLERFPDIVAGLLAANVDVIVAFGIQAIVAAKQKTSSIPIVMGSSGDPVGSGVIASLARPGGNVTGLTMHHTELGEKWLQLLREAVRSLSSVGVIWDSTNPPDRAYLSVIEEAGRRSRLRVRPVEAHTSKSFEQAFEQLRRERITGVIVMGNAINIVYHKKIVDLALANRFPVIFAVFEAVKAGALMSYGADTLDLGRRAAIYVDKIFRGASPATLPVEQPTKYIFSINMKTARALGLMMPPSLLGRADQIVE